MAEHHIKAIVTDIEGTTSSISFVKDVLFPYAREALAGYLPEHAQEPHIKGIIEDVQSELPSDASSLEDVIKLLQHWIDTDQKKTPLKTLQGYIWQAGYENGDFTAHMYPDAVSCLKRWSVELPVYVYSSGSIKAQDLFFTYSDFGNIKGLFSGFFDTTSGSKKEPASYTGIAESIGLAPENILFLTDSLDEIKAAKKAGFQLCMIQREQNTTEYPGVAIAINFEEVENLFLRNLMAE